jgi:nucleoside-diphosphate-sugar epimerase
LIASTAELERIVLVRGDITDLPDLQQVFSEHHVSHVIHLAALQAPFCKADPPLGAHVNVTGTVNILEAAKRHKLKTPVVYASSAAVYDQFAETMTPQTIYGAYKIANESSARIYWQEDRVPSVGLRPLVVYGPGRDRGMTASPSDAMAAAAKGENFTIPFGGRMQFQFAPDVARAFIDAARQAPTGAEVFNIGGPVVSMSDIVAAIQAAAPDVSIGFEDVRLPFPEQLPEPLIETQMTSLEEGVRHTIDVFRTVPTRTGHP